MRLIVEKEELIENIKIYLKIYRLFKSYLILLSDQEQMGIGNVTLASPPIVKGVKSISSSYKLFGIEDELYSKVLAERSSYILKAPVLFLIFIKTKNFISNNLKHVVNFLNKALDKI